MKASILLFATIFSLLSFSFLSSAQNTALNILNKTEKNKGENAPLKPRANSFLKKVDSTSGKDVILKNITALGGLENLKRVESLDFEGSIKISGASFSFSERKHIPNQDYIALSIDRDTILRSFFDGKVGYNQEIGEKKFLPSEEIKERNKDYLGLFNQIYYLDSSQSFSLESISKGKLEDRSVFQLDIRMPSGKKLTEFYDAENFLLNKSIETEIIDNKTIITQKTFTNYKKINGIQFPYDIHIIKNQDDKDQEILISIETTQINLPTE